MKHFIIPNELTFTLMIIGFLKSFDPNLNPYLFPDYIHSLIGGVVGYSIIWLIIFAYKKLKNKEGMGLGDAKLLSAIGFWFGWVSIPFILFFSSFVALAFAVPSLINKSKMMMDLKHNLLRQNSLHKMIYYCLHNHQLTWS